MSNDNNDQKDFIDMREGDSKSPIPPEQQAPRHETPIAPPSLEKRKRRFPGWAIALIFLAIGLAIGISSLNFNGFHWNLNPFSSRDSGFIRQPSDRDLTNLTFAVGDLNSMEVRLSIDAINVRTHNGRDIRVVYDAPRSGNYNRPVYNFNQRTGHLEIFTEGTIMGVNIRSGNLRIYLPENSNLGDLALRTSTGNIEISMSGENIAETLDLRSTTGRINARNFSAGRIAVQSTTGRIELESLQSGNNLTANSTTGNIDGTNLQAGGDLRISATTGRINLTDVNGADGEFRSTTGNITLNAHDRPFDNVSITATTGRINARRFYAESVTIRSTTGNIDISNITTTSNFTASASTGQIIADNLEVEGGLSLTTTTGNINLDASGISRDASFRASTGRVVISDTGIDGLLEVRTTTGNVNLTRVNTDMNRADITTNRSANVTIN
ncbi:MAG: DUF4097 domain-containing protein [Defluviitaleaceae bacterium]|nr:DUF4097 domain-containing protein [Defluviitaleaceae bacterium]